MPFFKSAKLLTSWKCYMGHPSLSHAGGVRPAESGLHLFTKGPTAEPGTSTSQPVSRVETNVTTRCTCLYGRSSFYTFCCITVQDKQSTNTESNHRETEQQAFHFVTLTRKLILQHLSGVEPTTRRRV